MSIKHAFAVSVIIGTLFPLVASAQIVISEIMYDPSGTDTKREWIEVFNASASAVDLSTYFLLEGGIFHKLAAVGGLTLPAGEYAIIADSPTDVLVDFPSYAGLVFDSAFSLVNTGEALVVANAQKETVHTYAYNSSMGGTGDGQSLQITDGVTVHAAPTFGTINKTGSETVATQESEQTQNTGNSQGSTSGASSHSQQEPLESYAPSGPFKIGAGRDRAVLVGVPVEFRATLSKPDAKPSFLWNFGDFSTKRGRVAKHAYAYPGTYQVVLEAKNADHKAISRTEVTVLEPDFEISTSMSTLSITNRLATEVNVGQFVLVSTKGRQRIPENTIIDGGSTLTVAWRSSGRLISILYPDDTVYKNMASSTDLVQYEH